MKLFLSHSSADKSLVREIKSQLHDFLDCWLDERQLIPGESVVNVLERAVSESDLLILFISRNSLHSNWVNSEIEWALEKELKLGKPFLIPIVLDDSKPPKSIESKLYFTLSSQSENDVKSLSDELNEKLFHYVVKYGISEKESHLEAEDSDRENELEGTDKVMSLTVTLMKSAKNYVFEKFSELIENNIELKPKTILLLCKSELEQDVLELESEAQREAHKTNENDEKDDDDKGIAKPMIMLKGMSNVAKENAYKEIQRKLNFIFENEQDITDEEGVYMLKKHLVKRES